MNWFKLYIGDYQRDTAALSVTEHGAYLLMLQHYYATERPLPTGKALHRMLRATEKVEREAIDSVAAQFWTQTPAGLVNPRADAEIAKAGAQAETNRVIAQAREARRKQAKTSDESSTNRGADERGRPQKSSEKSSKKSGKSPGGVVATEAGQESQVTDSTGAGHDESSTNRVTNTQPNQTPDTRHQTKAAAHTPSQEETGPPLRPPVRAACPVEEPPDPEPPPALAPPSLDATQRRCVDIALRLRAQAVDATAHHPTVLGWVEVGASDDVLQAAVARARERKPAGQIPVGYLDPIVRELLAPPPRRAAKAVEWWSSDSATLAKAAELGIAARAGEDWQALRGRIRTAIERQEARA